MSSGAFHIYVASETEPSARLVGQYEGSGSFGELALMYNMPRAATVQVNPCFLLDQILIVTDDRDLLANAWKEWHFLSFSLVASGHEPRIVVGNGSHHFQEDRLENGLQKTQDVRNPPGNGAHVASIDGKTRFWLNCAWYSTLFIWTTNQLKVDGHTDTWEMRIKEKGAIVTRSWKSDRGLLCDIAWWK